MEGRLTFFFHFDLNDGGGLRRYLKINPCSHPVWIARGEILLFSICHGSGAISVLKTKQINGEKSCEAKKSHFPW